MSDPTPHFTPMPMPANVTDCRDRAENDADIGRPGRAGQAPQGEAMRATHCAPPASGTHEAECLLGRYRRSSRPVVER